MTQLESKIVVKATELRIGNWVNHCWIHNQGTKVNWEHKQIVPNDIPACIKYSDTYEPIPLTEEWLIRLGLVHTPKWKGDTTYSIEGFLHFSIDFDDNGSYIEHYTGTAKLIEYVHQLQNLYFALTGEELIIKS